MASWVTQATDDFNRANADPLDGSWATGSGLTRMALSSNHVIPGSLGSDCGSRSTARTWADDQSSSAILTCTGTAGTGSGIGLTVRMSASANTLYRFVIDHASPGNNFHFDRDITGGLTTLLAGVQAFTDGDRFTFRVSGPASAALLELLRNGVLVQSFTDNSVLQSGSPGLFYSSSETAATIDDWEGGELTGLSSDNPPIGLLGRGAGW